jgi:SAM-dependent methyltransferase
MTSVEARGLFEEFPYLQGSGDGEFVSRYLLPNLPAAPKSVLDFGSGIGASIEIARHFSAARVMSLDFSNAAGAAERGRAAQLRNLEVLAQDPLQPLASRVGELRYDLILSLGVLMLTPDPAAWLGNLRRVITDDGLLVVMLYGKHGCFELELELELVEHFRQTTQKSDRELRTLCAKIAQEPELQSNRFHKLAPLTPGLLWGLLRDQMLSRNGRAVHAEERAAGDARPALRPLHNRSAKEWIESIETAGFRLDRFVFEPTSAGLCVPHDALAQIRSSALRSELTALSPVDQYQAFDLIFRPMLHIMAFRPR